MIFGQPEQWLALLIESLLAAGHGEAGRSQLRPPRSRSTGDCRRHQRPAVLLIADADSRIGPALEAVINGRHYCAVRAPDEGSDRAARGSARFVWTPAHREFENGGESVALIPTRYAGSAASGDGLLALARKTVWEEIAPDTHRGLGQRVLTTDAADVPLLEVRTISLTSTVEAADVAGSHG